MTKRNNNSEDDFPSVWDAGEDLIDLNKIINKHVFLALEEYWDDLRVLTDTSNAGGVALSIGFAEEGPCSWIKIDVEEVFLNVAESHVGPDTLILWAASFERCAGHLKELAKNSTIANDEREPEPEERIWSAETHSVIIKKLL